MALMWGSTSSLGKKNAGKNIMDLAAAEEEDSSTVVSSDYGGSDVIVVRRRGQTQQESRRPSLLQAIRNSSRNLLGRPRGEIADNDEVEDASLLFHSTSSSYGEWNGEAIPVQVVAPPVAPPVMAKTRSLLSLGSGSALNLGGSNTSLGIATREEDEMGTRTILTTTNTDVCSEEFATEDDKKEDGMIQRSTQEPQTVRGRLQQPGQERHRSLLIRRMQSFRDLASASTRCLSMEAGLGSTGGDSNSQPRSRSISPFCRRPHQASTLLGTASRTKGEISMSRREPSDSSQLSSSSSSSAASRSSVSSSSSSHYTKSVQASEQELFHQQSQDVLHRIQDSIVRYIRHETDLRKSKLVHLDRAKARYHSANQTGAVLSMKRMKRLLREQTRVLYVIGYLRTLETELLQLIGTTTTTNNNNNNNDNAAADHGDATPPLAIFSSSSLLASLLRFQNFPEQVERILNNHNHNPSSDDQQNPQEQQQGGGEEEEEQRAQEPQQDDATPVQDDVATTFPGDDEDEGPSLQSHLPAALFSPQQQQQQRQQVKLLRKSPSVPCIVPTSSSTSSSSRYTSLSSFLSSRNVVEGSAIGSESSFCTTSTKTTTTTNTSGPLKANDTLLLDELASLIGGGGGGSGTRVTI